MIEQVTIRPATPKDIPFIFSSWLKSYQDSSFAQSVRKDIYYSEHHALIDTHIKKGSVFCAVNKTDDEQIFGWISCCLTTPVPSINYIYVKHPFRSLGIAKALMAIVPFPYIYTHAPKKQPPTECTFNPYVFYREGIL